ncbi:hypothetical protein E2562_014058 [Oryza meyeriana var. granulata]|uniref:NAC domain-containing protein n=1 Tax=Oryza meyeriana var. granulata TaxID=110450 RepID=A0A6G1DJU9_9ORYZ|nr:hypothetical protein E2562_014058 [Oryza meyeriana var. granulata]
MADEIALEPGLAFRPSDDDLITLFLRPKIGKTPFEERIINNDDVYSADPAELVGRHKPAPGTQGSSSVWYFFCPPRYTSKRASSGRRQRAIGGRAGGESVWKSEGGKKAVNGVDGRRVGYLQKFSYGVYESSGSGRTFTRLGWCMTEYGLDDNQHAAADGAEKRVLCKVYRSPRAVCAEAARSADLSCSGGSKRKADDGVDDHPEAPPSARPRQEAESEQEQEQPEFLPDLETLLSIPMDDNSRTATMEQLFHDEPLPCAPTMEVVDGGSGDEFI